MNWRSECAAVIPCLNEARAIRAVVEGARAHLATVFVVDDGSTDRTSLLARQAGAEVLRHATSRGKGASLQAGWRRAREEGFRWVLMLDGDGQHSTDDIPALLHGAERTGADLVVGNRMPNAGQMPWLRRVVNRWMSAQLSRVAGCSLPDSQCGFRLMNLEAWAGLPVSATHFEIESDTLLAFARARCRIEFVPIQVIYKGERSKIRPVRDTIRWFRWWQSVRSGREVAKCMATKSI